MEELQKQINERTKLYEELKSRIQEREEETANMERIAETQGKEICQLKLSIKKLEIDKEKLENLIAKTNK